VARPPRLELGAFGSSISQTDRDDMQTRRATAEVVPRSAGEGPVFRRASQVTTEHEEAEKRHEQGEEGERQQTSFRGMRRVLRHDGRTGGGKQDYIAESGAPAKVRAVCLARSAETLNHHRCENGNKEKEERERDEMSLTGQAVGD
jgi:hypothetical protein